MPELPEVETTRRGIRPLLVHRTLSRLEVRDARLRWPVVLPADLPGQRLQDIRRRAKYLLFEFDDGTLIIHLGMSGNLRVLPEVTPYLKHDHLEMVFDTGQALRLNDPRRFGSVHWQPLAAETHWLLRSLGPEPFSEAFNGRYLKRLARGRRSAVKTFLMDARVVVGVGNIYANEALFAAGVRPTVRAGRVSLLAYERIVTEIRAVLSRAIEMGGTTLRDFVRQDGNPGYFRQSLNVYGRDGQPCRVCGTPLTGIRVGQRATVYCKICQKSQGFTEQPVLKS